MTTSTHDPKLNPRPGDTALRGRTRWTVCTVQNHLDSTDIAWLHLASPSGARCAVTYVEWAHMTFKAHEAGVVVVPEVTGDAP